MSEKNYDQSKRCSIFVHFAEIYRSKRIADAIQFCTSPYISAFVYQLLCITGYVQTSKPFEFDTLRYLRFNNDRGAYSHYVVQRTDIFVVHADAAVRGGFAYRIAVGRAVKTNYVCAV